MIRPAAICDANQPLGTLPLAARQLRYHCSYPRSRSCWEATFMRHFSLFSFGGLAVCLAVSTAALASKPDPDDYPLRVHILKFVTRPSSSREPKHPSDAPDYVSGMGVADLFENGDPRGFQFSFSCIGGLKASSGYANFPARWKKKDKTLE